MINEVYQKAQPEHLILKRSSKISVEQIDLSSFYNAAPDDSLHHKPGNTFSELPQGLQFLDGVWWDIRGIIQLTGKNAGEITGISYPDEVIGIKIGLHGKTIHFLHASAWNINSEEIEIGCYEIVYQDEQKALITLVYKENIFDWWGNPLELGQIVAWRGSNERTSQTGNHIRLFHLVWVNPEPEKEIKYIHLKSNGKGPGPMIVGTTVDRI